MKHWSVYGSVPPPPEATGRDRFVSNKTIEVVCIDAQRALELVKQKYPTIEIHSIQHRGKVEIIEDSK